MADKREDRISDLPDCILHIILSFLGSTKQVIRTCLLSKRWQFLWLDVTEIDLIYGKCNANRKGFVDFVSKMLSMRSETETHLNKFAVNFYFKHCFANNVDDWVDFAIENKVENIELMFDYACEEDYYPVNQKLYSHSSLTSLSLRGCDMAPPRAAIKWECLKSLCLYSIRLMHCSVMENIISGCRVLEVLSLTECSFPEVEEIPYTLNISLRSLTTLKIHNWHGERYEISAPYVINLSIYEWGRLGFSLKNVSSDLVRPKLSLDPEYCEELFESLKFVTELEWDTKFMSIGYLSKMRHVFFQFTLLRCLTINAYVDKKSISHIIEFLEWCPMLESLFIKGDGQRNYNYWNVTMDFTMSHLKTVKITDFIQDEDEDKAGEPMLTLVQILLKNAKVLQKIVISAKGLNSPTDVIKIISHKVDSFPRASHEAIIEFDI